MSTQTKLFTILSLLVAIILVGGCGIQPVPLAQGDQQTGSPQESATEEEHQAENAKEAEIHGDQDEHVEEAVELSAIDLAGGEKLKVLATTNIVADLVRNVGGDMIALTSMLPMGADPHTFVPTPQDATAVAKTHVVFINGFQLEAFLGELIENAGGEAPVVALSTNVEPRELQEMEADAHGHDEDEEHDEELETHEVGENEHEDEHGHAHAGADPHIWMTPTNAIVMVHNIEHALSELDPANAEAYEANATAYEAQLEELDSWVRAQIDTIPAENRQMVTDHDAFGYYADRYGLKVVGAVIPATSTNAEPSAQEFADLIEKISKLDVKAVFVGTTVNPTLAERITEDTGISLVPLYTESLGEPGSGVETYLDFMRYNTTTIVEALK